MHEWIDYLMNEEDKLVFHNEHGLIAFNCFNKEVHVTDFYIKKESRGSQEGLALAKTVEKFAENEECLSITANIFINKKNKSQFDYKVRIFSKFGFLPSSAHNNVVTMIKEL